MFENLWEEWFDTQLFLLAKGTPMAGMGYHEIFQCLPKEKQDAHHGDPLQGKPSAMHHQYHIPEKERIGRTSWLEVNKMTAHWPPANIKQKKSNQ